MDSVAPAQLRHKCWQEGVREGPNASMCKKKKKSRGCCSVLSCKLGGVLAIVQMEGSLHLTEVIHLRQ